jgi:Domain of unknown function (DUF4062)
MRNITEIGVFIGSPNDLSVERAIVKKTIEDHKFSENGKDFRLMPIMWEEAIPDIGAYPQDVINKQLIEQSDIFIFMFHMRLGTTTPHADSGTLEELDLAISAHLAEPYAKGVSVFFSSKPIDPHSIDVEQLRKLQEFRKNLSDRKILSQDFLGNESLKSWVDKTLKYHLTKIARFTSESESEALPKKKIAEQGESNKYKATAHELEETSKLLALSTSKQSAHYDDDGDGILESISIIESSMNEQASAMKIIAETTSSLGVQIGEQTKKLDTFKKLNISVDNATLQSISNGVAAVLEQWNEKVGPETDKLGPKAFEGIVALENSLSLIEHSNQLESIPEEFYNGIYGLVDVISQVQPSIEGLRETLTKTPPLTRKLKTQIKKAIKNLEIFEEFMRISKVSYSKAGEYAKLTNSGLCVT